MRLFKIIVGLIILVFYSIHCDGCGKKINGPESTFYFPLETGKSWKYIDSTGYHNLTDVISTVTTDTLEMTILNKKSDNWCDVEFLYFSEGLKTADTSFFINSDSGLLVMGYFENASKIPLFKQTVSADALNPVILLPSENTPEEWLVYKGRTARKGADQELILNGETIKCKRIDYYSDILEDGNQIWISSLYYTDTSIVKKVYKPDTLVENHRSIIISRSLVLIP